jgi:hypothetical protein
MERFQNTISVSSTPLHQGFSFFHNENARMAAEDPICSLLVDGWEARINDFASMAFATVGRCRLTPD